MPIDVDVVPESIHRTQLRENVRGLWFGLLAGPVIYALYFIAGYLLAEAVCQGGFLTGQIGRFSWLFLLLEGLTLVSMLLTVAAAWYSFRIWQRQREDLEHAGGSLPFMGFGGLLLNLLFTFFIAVTGVSVLFIQWCEWL